MIRRSCWYGNERAHRTPIGVRWHGLLLIRSSCRNEKNRGKVRDGSKSIEKRQDCRDRLLTRIQANSLGRRFVVHSNRQRPGNGRFWSSSDWDSSRANTRSALSTTLAARFVEWRRLSESGRIRDVARYDEVLLLGRFERCIVGTNDLKDHVVVF